MSEFGVRRASSTASLARFTLFSGCHHASSGLVQTMITDGCTLGAPAHVSFFISVYSGCAYEGKDNLRLEALCGISWSLGVFSGYGTGTVREVFGPVLALWDAGMYWVTHHGYRAVRRVHLMRAHCIIGGRYGGCSREFFSHHFDHGVEQAGSAAVGSPPPSPTTTTAHFMGSLHASRFRGRFHAGTAAGAALLRGSAVHSSSTKAPTLRHSVHVPGLTGGFWWENEGPHAVLVSCMFM